VTTGDGVLALFDGTERAIQAAVDIREAVPPLELQVRAGIHTGEVELLPDDFADSLFTSPREYRTLSRRARSSGPEPPAIFSIDIAVGGSVREQSGDSSPRRSGGRWVIT
jgi:class 3 adenylate cyclase